MCWCICVCDLGRSKSHHCGLVVPEFNSISVFLPSPRLRVVYRINCKSDLLLSYVLKQSMWGRNLFRVTMNYPSPRPAVQRVKIKCHRVEILLLRFEPFFGLRAAFEAGRCLWCISISPCMNQTLRWCEQTMPSYCWEDAQDARHDTFTVLQAVMLTFS